MPACCRYHPTCSEYVVESISQHGVVKGLFLGIKRISRCHPWHSGGYDPVPAAESRNPRLRKSESHG